MGKRDTPQVYSYIDLLNSFATERLTTNLSSSLFFPLNSCLFTYSSKDQQKNSVS